MLSLPNDVCVTDLDPRKCCRICEPWGGFSLRRDPYERCCGRGSLPYRTRQRRQEEDGFKMHLRISFVNGAVEAREISNVRLCVTFESSVC
jgi:hypothetical protein